MTILLRIILILVSLFTVFYMLRRIRKSQMNIEDTVFWMVFAFGLLLFSIFPSLADVLAKLLGVGSTVNFLFLSIIFLLLIKQFLMTIKISNLETKLKTLVQKIAIQNNDKK
ncbi:MAG: DUF2304 domain-containing protein [Clostridia bacterium]